MCHEEFVGGGHRDDPGYHGHVGIGVGGEDHRSRVLGRGDDLAGQPLGPVEVGPSQRNAGQEGHHDRLDRYRGGFALAEGLAGHQDRLPEHCTN
jgi:hypothetical protein